MSSNPPRPEPSITSDPVYYGIAVFFAFATTALGMWLGRPWFMASMQTVVLWIFALATFRQRNTRRAILILALWCAAQALAVAVMSIALPQRAEMAVGGGFLYREALLEWGYAGGVLPASWGASPLPRVIDLFGVTVGAALTAGLFGVWCLVRMVNLYAFGLAAMLESTRSAWGLIGGIAPWTLLRIIGSICTIATLSQIGFTGEWLPSRWPVLQRRVLWAGLALLLADILIELAL